MQDESFTLTLTSAVLPTFGSADNAFGATLASNNSDMLFRRIDFKRLVGADVWRQALGFHVFLQSIYTPNSAANQTIDDVNSQVALLVLNGPRFFGARTYQANPLLRTGSPIGACRLSGSNQNALNLGQEFLCSFHKDDGREWVDWRLTWIAAGNLGTLDLRNATVPWSLSKVQVFTFQILPFFA